MKTTKIQWADSTFNCWRGCTRVSAGCYNCYAEAQAKRNPAVLGVWGPEGRRVAASEARWSEVFRWERDAAQAGVRRRVFCGSMCDLFEVGTTPAAAAVMDAGRARLFGSVSDFNPGVIYETPHLDWLLLTKRPGNMRPIFDQLGLPGWWDMTAENRRNAWLGVSVEDNASARARIPVALKVPAVVHFVSVEPLLRPVNLTDFLGPDKVNWVIVGGESGPDARECNVAWVEEVVDQCDNAGVPVFVKQLGANATATKIGGYTNSLPPSNSPKRDDPAEWPLHLRRQEFPTVLE